MLLLIDNYDSFTYNLVQYLGNGDVRVFRNDALTAARSPPAGSFASSPGPCTPMKQESAWKAVRFFQGRIPILGVCLGTRLSDRHLGEVVRRSA